MAKQLLLTVLTIVGLVFLAQLFKVYFHSEVFGRIFESTAVMASLISPILIFGKRMPPEREKGFLKNHPVDTKDLWKRKTWKLIQFIQVMIGMLSISRSDATVDFLTCTNALSHADRYSIASCVRKLFGEIENHLCSSIPT